MISGLVTAEREPVIEVSVYDAAGAKQIVRAVVDTGFDGWLSLPSSLVEQFRLPWKRRGRGWLADGSECVFDIYDGPIEWDGSDRRVPIDEAETFPLVGMSLLDGCELTILVWDGGRVDIVRPTS